MSIRTLATLALLCIPASAMSQTGPDPIVGAWVTPLAEQSVQGASAFARERLVFEAATNTIAIEVFADAEAQFPLFTYASSGSYRTLGPSSEVEGAWDMDAENDVSTVTIFQDAPDLWPALNLGACPLEVGVAVDISDCVAGPPFNAADCVELDLVAVTAEGLRLGARDTDRCLERPTALGETLYQRPRPHRCVGGVQGDQEGWADVLPRHEREQKCEPQAGAGRDLERMVHRSDR